MTGTVGNADIEGRFPAGPFDKGALQGRHGQEFLRNGRRYVIVTDERLLYCRRRQALIAQVMDELCRPYTHEGAPGASLSLAKAAVIPVQEQLFTGLLEIGSGQNIGVRMPRLSLLIKGDVQALLRPSGL